MLYERGVTPTTSDQTKFDVFVTSLQDAPAWREKKKLEKAERASQKKASADAHALGLGPSSWETRKHTLASYLMGPNAVGRQPSIGRKVYSVFSTVFWLLLLLVVAVGCPAACFG